MQANERSWSLPEKQTWAGSHGDLSCDCITLRLHGMLEGSIFVPKFDTVSAITEKMELGDVRYIHCGRVVSPSLSLAYLGIKNGDDLYIIAENRQQCLQYQFPRKNGMKRNPMQKLRERFDEKWATKFRDPDSVFEQLRDASDPVTAYESARLADLYRARIESNVSAYRKVCDRFAHMNDCNAIKGIGNNTTILPEKADSPSTNFLPELWLNSPSANIPTQREI